MLVDEVGDVTITNDGNTNQIFWGILTTLEKKLCYKLTNCCVKTGATILR